MGIGILGGTFDPIHEGHLHIAKRVKALFGLKEVYLVVSAVPPHKSVEGITSPYHRFAMCAIATNKWFDLKVSTVELEDPKNPYTIETLRKFDRLFGKEHTLFSIIGSDSYLGLKDWKDSTELIQLYNIIVVERPEAGLGAYERDYPPAFRGRLIDLRQGSEAEVRKCVAESVRKGTRQIYLVNIGALGISSTEIRDRFRRGQPVVKYISPGVSRYIEKHKIYRDDARDFGNRSRNHRG